MFRCPNSDEDDHDIEVSAPAKSVTRPKTSPTLTTRKSASKEAKQEAISSFGDSLTAKEEDGQHGREEGRSSDKRETRVGAAGTEEDHKAAGGWGAISGEGCPPALFPVRSEKSTTERVGPCHALAARQPVIDPS